MCSVSPESIDEFLKSRLNVDGEQNKTAIVLVGGPGSGKSSVKSNILGILGMGQSNFVNIDPDEILTVLFRNDNSCRRNVNEINDISFERAISENKNIIFDGTGKDFDYYQTDVIKRLKKIGYVVNLCIVHNNVESAIFRVKKRAETHGRDVPVDYLQYVYTILEMNIPKYMGMDCDYADTIYLYDNSSEVLHLIYSTNCEDGSKHLKCVGNVCSSGGKRCRKSKKRCKKAKKKTRALR